MLDRVCCYRGLGVGWPLAGARCHAALVLSSVVLEIDLAAHQLVGDPWDAGLRHTGAYQGAANGLATE
jgi:hypothetical protein